MYYYVMKNAEQNIVGWLESSEKMNSSDLQEVSKQQYVEYGGNPSPDFVSQPSEDSDSASINAFEYLDAQIKAVSNRQDFIEDCIAEMAYQVYTTST